MPHFAKRHYEAIAKVIRDLTLSDDELDELGLIEIQFRRRSIASEFADMFQRDNPRFDKSRFISAATTEE